MIENKSNNIEEVHFSRPPKTWLVESILVTFFCCIPFGIAGIVNASKVETLYNSGDIEGAERASQEAGKWTKIGFWSMLVIIGLYILLILATIVFGISTSDF